MDIKKYIESGILESYVIGSISEQDRQAVECLSHIYPEIKSEILSLQSTLEQVALKDALNPPAHIKPTLVNRIKSIVQDKPNTQATSSSTSNSSRVLIAITILAFTLLAILGFFYYNSSNENTILQEEYALLEQQNKSQEDQLEVITQQLDKEQLYNSILSNPGTQVASIAGTAKSPEAIGQVFWSSDNQLSLLKIESLPDPQPDKQYQLWAIIDGNPTDMGVLAELNEVVEFNYQFPTQGVQAFAITLEEKGGSPVPTLDEMYVFGET